MTTSESTATASWKRPWSLNEIISYSNNWSLAGDSGVCELLKRFSSDLITEVTQVNYNLSELQIESKQLNVEMENVSNDLCMLANDQFIENLVEEVHDTGFGKVSHDTSEKTKDDKIAHTVPLVMQALRLGLQVLENQFDIIDVTRMGSMSHNCGESDMESQTIPSASDFQNNESIYQPKDPYENRHLPHLIGTVNFVEDVTLGIGYIDDIEEGPDISVESASEVSLSGARQDFLTSSSDEEDHEEESKDLPKAAVRTKQSYVHKSSESDDMFDIKSPSKSADLFNEDEDNDHSEDLFYEDLSKDAVKTNKSTDNVEVVETRPLTLSEQLNKQLKERLSIGTKPSDVVSEKSEDQLSITNKSISVSKVDRVSVMKVTAPESVPWSNDGGEDDDDDIFADTANNKSKALTSISKPVVSPIVKRTTEPENQRLTLQKEVAEPKVSNVTKQSVLPVEDSESDSDNLFKSTSTAKKKEVRVVAPIASKVVTTKKTTPLSSDDEGDLFNVVSNKTKSLTNGARSTAVSKTVKTNTLIRNDKKGSGVISKRPTTVTNPFNFSSDDDDDDDLFKVGSATKKPVAPVSKPPVIVPESPKKKSHKSESSNSDTVSTKPNISSDNKNKGQESKKVESDESSDDMFSSNVQKKVVQPDPLLATEKKTHAPISKNKHITSDPLLSDHKKTGSPSIDRKGKTSDPLLSPNKKADPPLSDKKVVPPDPLLATRNHANSPLSETQVITSDPLLANHVEATIKSKDLLSENQNDLFHTFDSEKTKVKSRDNSPSNNADSEVNNVEMPRPSTRRSIPVGGVSMFGGFTQSNNNESLINEMIQRQRISKGKVVDEIKEDDEEEEHKTRVMTTRESPVRTMMHRVKDESPVDDRGVTLDVPPTNINQLNNLTKNRPSISGRRRPGARKIDIVNEDPIIITENTQQQAAIVPVAPAADTDGQHEQKLSQANDDDIFANLPPPEKKNKSKKKDTTKSKSTVAPVEVDVAEIDDIFAVASGHTAPKKKTASKKKSKSGHVLIDDDPLGAL